MVFFIKAVVTGAIITRLSGQHMLVKGAYMVQVSLLRLLLRY